MRRSRRWASDQAARSSDSLLVPVECRHHTSSAVRNVESNPLDLGIRTIDSHLVRHAPGSVASPGV